MSTYDRNNSFIFSRNDRKERENQPDLTGNFTDENGVEFFMNIWAKEKNGRKFFTGTMKKKEQRQKEGGQSSDPFVEDTPF